VLASELGAEAVAALIEEDVDKMVGRVGDALTRTPLPDTWTKRRPFDRTLYELARVLST
jgi:hypothetical protein